MNKLFIAVKITNSDLKLKKIYKNIDKKSRGLYNANVKNI